MIERIYHQEVPIDDITEADALAHISDMMDQGYTRQIVTLTIQMYVAARRDPNFLETLNNATLVLPESTGLKLYSQVIPPRFGKIPGGVYLAKKAVEVCSDTGKRVVIFGSSPTNRSLARDNLRGELNYPDIHTIDGEYDFSNPTDSLIVADQIDRLSPDLTIMAGNEIKAEKWIQEWLLKRGARAGVVGGYGLTVDHWAGDRWVPTESFHRFGLSWLMMLPERTPERRKAYLAGLLGLVKLGFEDAFNLSAKEEEIVS